MQQKCWMSSEEQGQEESANLKGEFKANGEKEILIKKQLLENYFKKREKETTG